MKSKWSKLLGLLLCLVLAFAFTACNDLTGTGGNGGDGGDGGNISDGGNGGNVSDGGSLAAQEYINVDFALTASGGEQNAEMDAVLYLKKTDAGYDFVVESEETGDFIGASVDGGVTGEELTYTSKLNGWYLDGLLVTGTAYTLSSEEADGEEWTYSSNYFGTVNEALAVAGLTGTDLDEAIGSLFADEAARTENGAVYAFDGKDIFNAVTGWVKANQNTALAAYLESVLDTDRAGIEARVDELLAPGQTVAGLIGDIETLLGDVGLTISFKGVFDTLQSALGLSTAAIITLINEQMGDASMQLPAPAEGKTVYDYLMDMVGGMSVEDVLGMLMAPSEGTELPAPETYAADAETGADEPTMSENVASVIKDFLYPADGSDALTIGEIIDQAFVSFGMSGFNANSLAMLRADALEVSATLKTDAAGKPVSIVAGMDIDIVAVNPENNEVIPLVSAAADATIAVTYGAPDGVTFTLPSDIVVPPTAMLGLAFPDLETALTDGFTIGMYPGQNWDYDIKLYNVALVGDYSLDDPGVYWAANKTSGSDEIIGDDGAVLATIAADADGITITLTKELFELYADYALQTGDAGIWVSYLSATDGTTWIYTFRVL